MRNLLFLLTVFLFTLTTLQSVAQETLVDVPSLEIVEAKKLFLQQQAVFSKEGINSSSTIALGLGKNLEVGFFLNQLVFQRSKGLEINPANPENNPDFFFTSQKAFDVTDWLKLGLGTRVGINAARAKQEIHFVNFNYINSQYKVGSAGHKMIAGVYYANNAYTGSNSNTGAMAGIDLNLTEDKLHLIGEFLTGNSLGSISTAIEISLPKQWKISGGVQFPFSGSDNPTGAIFQISKN